MTGYLAVEHRVGPVDEIPVGEGRAYEAGGETVAVFRLRDGSVRAVSAVCPHAGGPIADGLADRRVVVCPMHQHSYDLTTGCSTTGQPPLRVYPVRVDPDGDLVVGLPTTPTPVGPPTTPTPVGPPTTPRLGAPR